MKRRTGPRARRLVWPLAGIALTSAAAAVAQSAPSHAPAAAPAEPLRFPAIEPFLDAIAIDEAAAQMIDSFWQPAIEAFVAANPRRADEARSFAAARRARELAVYRPLVASSLDNQAMEILYPEFSRELGAFQREFGRLYAAQTAIPESVRLGYALRLQRLRAEPDRRFAAELAEATRLARTPDGVALRELNARGLYFCALPRFRRDPASCEPFDRSPLLARLRAIPHGDALIRLSAAANGFLLAMVQMGHAAGISLHALLPPDAVGEAGFEIPQDMSFEELVGRGAAAARSRT